MRVLTVDDNPMNIEFVNAILEGFGCTMDTAKDGKEALFMADCYRYDLLVTDVKMPNMDGLELYCNVVKRVPHLKGRVIFTTGEDSPMVEAFIREAGCQYLRKPFLPLDLIRAVGSVMG